MRHSQLQSFTVHGSGRCVAPFMRQRLGLPHELAHCIIPVWGQLVNVALLPLMGRVWVRPNGMGMGGGSIQWHHCT